MKLQITNDIIAEAYSPGRNDITGCLIATTVREYVREGVEVQCGWNHLRIGPFGGGGQVYWMPEALVELVRAWSDGVRVTPQEIEIDIPAHFLREETEIDLAQPTETSQEARTEALANAK